MRHRRGPVRPLARDAGGDRALAPSPAPAPRRRPTSDPGPVAACGGRSGAARSRAGRGPTLDARIARLARRLARLLPRRAARSTSCSAARRYAGRRPGSATPSTAGASVRRARRHRPRPAAGAGPVPRRAAAGRRLLRMSDRATVPERRARPERDRRRRPAAPARPTVTRSAGCVGWRGSSGWPTRVERTDRALRRVGVLPVLAAGHRGRRRPAGPRVTCRPGRRRARGTCPPSTSTRASGTTPTTSCSPSRAATARSTKRECGTEPGEGVDRSPSRGRAPGPAATRADVREDIATLREDVEDLVEPVEEITQFDECMYTVGLQQRRGYLFRDRDGGAGQPAALSFDLRGSRLPALNVMAFPGEEPPQIECNEDAGGDEDRRASRVGRIRRRLGATPCPLVDRGLLVLSASARKAPSCTFRPRRRRPRRPHPGRRRWRTRATAPCPPST